MRCAASCNITHENLFFFFFLSPNQASWYEAFGMVAVAALVLWVAFLVRSNDSVKRVSIIRILTKIDSGLLKVIWATYQIIVSISWSLSVTFPEPVSNYNERRMNPKEDPPQL